MLEVLRLALTHGATRNPHLIYALIHKRQLFHHDVDQDAFDHHVRHVDQQVSHCHLHHDGLAWPLVPEASATPCCAAPPAEGHTSVPPLGRQGSGTEALNAEREASALNLIHTVTHFYGAHVEAGRAASAGEVSSHGGAASSSASASSASSSSSSAFCSVDKVVELIKDAAHRSCALHVTDDATGEEVKYKYLEDQNAQHFFTPYLWTQVLQHTNITAAVSWNSQRLRLFDLKEEHL